MRGKNPEHAVWSPDGKWLYVSAEEADSVDIIESRRVKSSSRCKVGDRPRGIGFLPDGSARYVAVENADTVNVFDTTTHDVIARIKAGKRSNGVVVHPDGKRVFVSVGWRRYRASDRYHNNTIVAKIAVGKRPWNMALTPDGKKLYVACGRSNAIAVIDTDANTKIAEIAVGELPWGVAIRCRLPRDAARDWPTRRTLPATPTAASLSRGARCRHAWGDRLRHSRYHAHRGERRERRPMHDTSAVRHPSRRAARGSSDGTARPRGPSPLRCAPHRTAIAARSRSSHRANGRHYFNPTLVARAGDPVRIVLANGMDEPTIAHWHGLTIDTANDGNGDVLVAPESTFDYAFTVRNRAGLYWYHPHPHGARGAGLPRTVRPPCRLRMMKSAHCVAHCRLHPATRRFPSFYTTAAALHRSGIRLPTKMCFMAGMETKSSSTRRRGHSWTSPRAAIAFASSTRRMHASSASDSTTTTARRCRSCSSGPMADCSRNPLRPQNSFSHLPSAPTSSWIFMGFPRRWARASGKPRLRPHAR